MILALIIGTLTGFVGFVILAKLAEKFEKIYTIKERRDPPQALAWDAPWQPYGPEGVYVRDVPGIAAKVFAWVKILCHFAAGVLGLLLTGEVMYWLVKNPEFIRIVIWQTPRVLCGTVILISVTRFFILLMKELLHPPKR